VPELDDQISQNEATLDQLKAALDQAEANRRLAQVSWDRDKGLVEKRWVTRQQGDVDLRNLNAQEAAVAAAQHNVTAQEKLLKQLRQNRFALSQPKSPPSSVAEGRVTTFKPPMMDWYVLLHAHG
jgi:multidrug resistance efflux pump